MTANNPKAMYVQLNKKLYRIPDQIRGQTYRLDGDIADTIIGANAYMQEELAK